MRAVFSGADHKNHVVHVLVVDELALIALEFKEDILDRRMRIDLLLCSQDHKSFPRLMNCDAELWV